MTHPTKVKRFPHYVLPFKYTCILQDLITSESTTLQSMKGRKYCQALVAVSDMKNKLAGQINGINPSSTISLALTHGKVDRKKFILNRHEKKANSFVHGIREHVRLGPKISETVKGKLSLGARILQLGGVKKVFKQLFGVGEGERLLKASQCYLSTTAGPIAGLLFISTQRVSFCSERSIKFSSPNGELVKFHYKVSIPLRKVKRVDPSENMKDPSQKYMEIVTLDNFEFWFMGFLNYQKSFNCLQQTLSQS